MGGCAHSQHQRLVANARFEEDAKLRAVKEDQVRKLLLLGTGESGKSTVFRQMIKLFGKGFSEVDRLAYRSSIVENVVEGTYRLILAAESESLSPHEDTKVHADFIMQNYETLQKLPHIEAHVRDHIQAIWKDPAIQEIYARRGKFQVFDSCAYFLDKVGEIAQDVYIPTDEDILRVRVRTSGMIQEEFEIKGLKMKLLDVGGQRNERRKWIHSFENVTAVIYVAAVSEYDQKCFEDEETHRIEEALKIFSETMNLSYFENTQIIFLLNKKDVFEYKFPRVPVRDFFPEFDGTTVEQGYEFFLNMFSQKLRPGRDPMYPHIISATDSQQMQAVFYDVRHIVVKNMLRIQHDV